LHTGLRRIGVDSHMYVQKSDSSDSSVDDFTPPQNLFHRLKRRIRRTAIRFDTRHYEESGSRGGEPFTDDRTPYGKEVVTQLPSSDIINLHWIRNFVDLRAFSSAVSAPIVWTLHDMNAFTGGCHYDEGCGRYGSKCGACPQLGSEDRHDLSRQVWKRKREAYGNKRGEMHIVAPSQWLAAEAKHSALFEDFPVSVIPYGVDVEIFKPRNQSAARRALDLPQGARVILFVAQSTANRRKGFSLLSEALRATGSIANLHLISVGSHESEISHSESHLHLGRVASERLLSVVYSAADVFVIPSLQDNLPNTVLEAIACGTPVVGFNTGGIPDMVRPGVTGWLAEVGNVCALREAIEQALSDEATRARMGRRCRAIAEEEYALAVQARRYKQLYAECLGR
jgi:glycosyltransferase involved in cell wall biosynthesis